MRTLVISDVHNHWDELFSALSAAGHKEDDRLIFLGDAIDSFTGAAAETLQMLDHMASFAKDPRHISIPARKITSTSSADISGNISMRQIRHAAPRPLPLSSP